MEILNVAGCPYEDEEGEVLNIRYRLEENETVHLGDFIQIEMMDGSIVKSEVKIINPKYAGDYAYVSQKAKQKVESGEYGMSEKTTTITGPCIATFVITSTPYHDVKTKDEIESRKLIESHSKMKCITPYKEINCGDKSIYDYVKNNYTVPAKVILYLQTTNPYIMCPGIYEHPFKKGTRLLGPYVYTDGYYWWDRDTWKYVIKYNVTLPQEFIDHVMSDVGTQYLEEFANENKSWSNVIKNWKESETLGICFLPDNFGDISLEDF